MKACSKMSENKMQSCSDSTTQSSLDEYGSGRVCQRRGAMPAWSRSLLP